MEQKQLEHGAYYKHLAWMTIPLLSMAVYLYGCRPLALCAVALVTGNLCDRLVAVLTKRTYRSDDYSNESFALVIALLLPATVSWYVLVMAVLAGVLIGKEAFGGYGSYPFHPAAVGYVVAAVSWPEQVFRYPQPHTVIPMGDVSGVALVDGVSKTLRNGGIPRLDLFSMFLGEFAGPIGTNAILILLACGLFLVVRRDSHMGATVSFLLTCALLAFLFPRQAVLGQVPFWENAQERFRMVGYELMSGAIVFSSVAIINEPFTCPKTRSGRVLYGILLGIVTTGFRYFGVYETGVCFAVLIVNSVSGWLNKGTDSLSSGRRRGRSRRKTQNKSRGEGQEA